MPGAGRRRLSRRSIADSRFLLSRSHTQERQEGKHTAGRAQRRYVAFDLWLDPILARAGPGPVFFPGGGACHAAALPPVQISSLYHPIRAKAGRLGPVGGGGGGVGVCGGVGCVLGVCGVCVTLTSTTSALNLFVVALKTCRSNPPGPITRSSPFVYYFTNKNLTDCLPAMSGCTPYRANHPTAGAGTRGTCAVGG